MSGMCKETDGEYIYICVDESEFMQLNRNGLIMCTDLYEMIYMFTL